MSSRPFPVTLSDLQHHSSISSLFRCSKSYSCTAVDEISTD